MTLPDDLRDSLRQMEERLGATNTLAVVREDPVTGEWTDTDGEPVDKEAIEGDPLVVIQNALVMPREQAEREGRDILGPAEGTPPENDVVRVDADSGDPDPDWRSSP